ncbi:hypothetical protein [Lederbergia citri]|uniref:Uncharacterized protein n=1 Tax=Lederbergia citri TaxID=2833580 RepID=A0A942YJP6_9BACI|nr:hypothetical protein [Lederbergia citri]MBS4197780.1 hypothetical protein [Lederbergia citri]
MEIYFSPEIMTQHYQLLNVVDSKNKAVGNLAVLFDEKKLYIYGILEEEGVGADFKDLVTPYVKGIAKANPEADIYSCLYVGCKKIELLEEEQEKK